MLKPEKVKYKGEWYEVLEVQPAICSNNPEVKTAYRVSEAAWIMNTEVEEVENGQDDTQAS
jgi:lipocalin